MTMNEFAEKVLEVMKEKGDNNCSVRLIEKEKNNGVKMTGISAFFSEDSIGPCIYLETYYEDYINGEITVEETAESIYRSLMERQGSSVDVDAEALLDWESMKKRIYPKLINAAWNQVQLEEMPHRLYLDFAVVYYLKVDDYRNGAGSIQIHNGFLNIWEQDEAAIYKAAMENLTVCGAPFFKDIRSIIPKWMRMDVREEENNPMYVLSNQRRYFGAAAMLDEELLESIYEQMGEYILLPSSVHELLVVPRGNKNMELGEFASMVHSVNATVVDREERLSDHVYIYNGSDTGVKIAA